MTEHEHIPTENSIVEPERYGPGPWVGEPDRLEWRHRGFPCLMLRGNPRLGAWCGYVGVPPGHPWYGDSEPECAVHGSVTYASKCAGHVCHVPQPGESDDVWWVGFDCGHAGDIVPGMQLEPGGRDSYKTVAYVRAECEQLADQAASLPVSLVVQCELPAKAGEQ